MNQALIPYLSTSAGACLTHDNWHELGIKIIAYDFQELVMKPGLDELKTWESIHQFLAWEGDIFLDARGLSFDNEGLCEIKSVYDGSVSRLRESDFWVIIHDLKPNVVLVPAGLTCPQAFDTILIWEHLASGYLLTNQPAQDGFEGLVYSIEQGQQCNISLLDSSMSHDFKLINPNCSCPTCSQGLTRAYLHYLFQSTPLLCQRYLIMHNVWSSI